MGHCIFGSFWKYMSVSLVSSHDHIFEFYSCHNNIFYLRSIDEYYTSMIFSISIENDRYWIFAVVKSLYWNLTRQQWLRKEYCFSIHVLNWDTPIMQIFYYDKYGKFVCNDEVIFGGNLSYKNYTILLNKFYLKYASVRKVLND